MSWDDARISCRCSNSGELVSIEDSTLNDLVLKLAGNTEDGTWIGGTDYETEGTMKWSDGSTWSYENWNSNAPNNGGTGGNQDCVSMKETGMSQLNYLHRCMTFIVLALFDLFCVAYC